MKAGNSHAERLHARPAASFTRSTATVGRRTPARPAPQTGKLAGHGIADRQLGEAGAPSQLRTPLVREPGARREVTRPASVSHPVSAESSQGPSLHAGETAIGSCCTADQQRGALRRAAEVPAAADGLRRRRPRGSRSFMERFGVVVAAQHDASSPPRRRWCRWLAFGNTFSIAAPADRR